MFDKHIEVFLTASAVSPEEVRGRTAVVIDVLRASTTIIRALSNGAREVIPVEDRGTAGRIASGMDPKAYVLGGEKDGERIEGYTLGNSPSEYASNVVSGKMVILSTTNGTPAIHAAADAEALLVGGFTNVAAVVEAVVDLDMDLTIVCAGWHKRMALEDTICAGLIIDQLLVGQSPANLSDTAYMALWLYRHDAADVAVPISRCNHARRLQALGNGGDVADCIAMDTSDIVPHLKDKRLTAYVPEAAEHLSSPDGRP